MDADAVSGDRGPVAAGPVALADIAKLDAARLGRAVGGAVGHGYSLADAARLVPT